MEQQRLALKKQKYNGVIKKKGVGFHIRRCWQLYVLLLPALAYFFIFNYVPMVGLQIAFRDYKFSQGMFGSDWVGFKHFITFCNYSEPLIESM